MKIAIVDDDINCINHLKDFLLNHRNRNQFVIEEYTSGKDFLLSQNKYDILFLDIELGDMLGVDLAVELREIDENVIIIFTTSHTDYISDAFRSMPFQYLLKPIKIELLHKELDRAIQTNIFASKKMEISWNNKKDFVLLKDIMYIEYYSRKLLIVTEKDKYNANGKISDLEKELKIYGFARIHNGFLVNINHLKCINTYDAIMKDGKILPISKKYLRDFKKIYAEVISGVVI